MKNEKRGRKKTVPKKRVIGLRLSPASAKFLTDRAIKNKRSVSGELETILEALKKSKK